MTRTTKITSSIAVAALAVALLAGCSQSAGKASDAAAPESAPAAVTPTPTASDIKPTFGKTVSYEDLEVAVGVPTAFTPSEYAAGGTLPNNVKITFTLKNTGTKNFDPSLFHTSMSSGGQDAPAVFDSNQNLGGAPTTSVLPGKTITWDEGYNVANPKDIVLDVEPDFDHEKSTWTF